MIYWAYVCIHTYIHTRIHTYIQYIRSCTIFHSITENPIHLTTPQIVNKKDKKKSTFSLFPRLPPKKKKLYRSPLHYFFFLFLFFLFFRKSRGFWTRTSPGRYNGVPLGVYVALIILCIYVYKPQCHVDRNRDFAKRLFTCFSCFFLYL